MRYGHQPWSEIAKMPVSLVVQLSQAVLDLVALENAAGQVKAVE